MNEPEIDWTLVDKALGDSVEVSRERPGPNWFTVSEFAKKYNLSHSYSAERLRNLMVQGVIERKRGAGSRLWYKAIEVE